MITDTDRKHFEQLGRERIPGLDQLDPLSDEIRLENARINNLERAQLAAEHRPMDGCSTECGFCKEQKVVSQEDSMLAVAGSGKKREMYKGIQL